MSNVGVDGVTNRQPYVDFMTDLSQATQVRDCDFSFISDKLNPGDIRMVTLIIQSLEKR